MTCDLCGGVLCLLGALGRLVWFRCRDCGAEQSVDAAEFAVVCGSDEEVEP